MKNNESVSAHINKAYLDIKAANILHSYNMYSHSISCCYYAVFHAIKAVLQADDIIAESHKQVLGAFNKQFVHPGKVSSFVSQAAYSLFERRNTLEYEPTELEGEDGSKRGIKLATQAVQEIIAFFEVNGINFLMQMK